jgi:protein associated with RNAse G/E
VSEVRVAFRKYDGTLHWNMTARLLGEDEHGVWAGVVDGTPIFLNERPMGPAESPHVVLFPREGWWTGCFNAEPHPTEIYCDIATVPVWPGSGEVTMIDLDLDVRRRRTGLVELLDEDEFAEHRVKFGYPPDVVAAAEAAAAHLMVAVGENREPFATAYKRWLKLVQ